MVEEYTLATCPVFRDRLTLPTVLVDTTYRLAYSVRDSRGATASVTFTAVVAAATAPVPDPQPDPQPPPGEDEEEDEDDEGPGVSIARLYNLPFTVSETGEREKTYRFSLSSSGEVTASLTGMNRDIDCRVNGSSCTNRGGTSDDSWNGALDAGTHAVTVYPYGGGSGSWTLSVDGPAGSIPRFDLPAEPVDAVRLYSLPFTVSETGEGEKTYRLRLDSRTEMNVSLTGMNRDIDCRVNGARCTNRGGRSDDSWSGTLAAGTHTVTVYPYGGGSGNWTLSVSGPATPPPPSPPTPTCPSGYTYVAAASRCERSQSFRMQAVETGVSGQQSYSFTLSSSSSVSVSLTGLTRDFDCKVGDSRCTNRGGSADDSWSGTLAAGTHTVVVYPYGGGRGDYTLTVAVNDVNLVSVVSPLGVGPEEIVCRKDGDVIDCPTPDGTIVVVGEDPGPPPGAGPGEGDPGPGPGPDPDDDDGTPPTGGPTTPRPEEQEQQLDTAVADALARLEECRVFNDLANGRSEEYDPSSYISAAQTAGNILDEIPHEGASCSDPREPNAHVNAIPGSEIHICPPFYSLSVPHRSRAIIHEGLHLMGIRHERFLLPGGEPDTTGRQMNESISASCYAE
jgi:hypothetical protein